jgi:signal transduction histidine kinase
MYELVHTALKHPDPILQNRAKYFTGTVTLGYSLGIIPILLIWDIPFDPAWGMWFVPLYSIPLVYAIVTYRLVDIKIVARKAFLYGVTLACVSGFLLLFNFSDEWVRRIYPGFPIWVIPLISALAAVAIGIFVWRKLREGELLKYEFITVVTHKFRTPLTHIKWAAENLSKVSLGEEDRTQVQFIQSANTKLVELTNLLMNVSETEDNAYSYKLESQDLVPEIEHVINIVRPAVQTKHLTITRAFDPDSRAICDVTRVRFVIQVLIENAAHYTPDNGAITISTSRHDNELIFSVHDTGIGIPKEELQLLFTNFYRGRQAKLTDTEGMGIGLFISKEVITRNRGRLWAESNGPGTGSTFAFSLPIAK